MFILAHNLNLLNLRYSAILYLIDTGLALFVYTDKKKFSKPIFLNFYQHHFQSGQVAVRGRSWMIWYHYFLISLFDVRLFCAFRTTCRTITKSTVQLNQSGPPHLTGNWYFIVKLFSL